MSEAEIEKFLRLEVKSKLKGLALKLSAAWFKGIPDRICLLPGGCVVFVELKAPGKKPTAIQKIVHKKFRNLGFRVDVIDSKEGVKKFIKEFEKC